MRTLGCCISNLSCSGKQTCHNRYSCINPRCSWRAMLCFLGRTNVASSTATKLVVKLGFVRLISLCGHHTAIRRCVSVWLSKTLARTRPPVRPQHCGETLRPSFILCGCTTCELSCCAVASCTMKAGECSLVVSRAPKWVSWGGLKVEIDVESPARCSLVHSGTGAPQSYTCHRGSVYKSFVAS